MPRGAPPLLSFCSVLRQSLRDVRLSGCGRVSKERGMSFEAVAAELKVFDDAQAGKDYSSRAHISEKEIQRWSALIGEPRAVLYDWIAVCLARGFHNSELSFEFCDAVANDIYGVISFADEIRPTLFWDVYLAFDEGEYYHNDKRDEDPSEVYTRPMIARILEDLPSCYKW
jgi:hypothetical protein